eukprot:Lankesteria_metandrocarpae@DN2262_c0_g1_i1.p1
MHWEVLLFISGYGVQLTASCILLTQIWKRQSVYGLSMDMFLCLLLSTISRCVWSFDTRLTDTFLVYMELIGSLITSILLCAVVYHFRHTTTKKPVFYFRVYVLVPLVAVFAMLFHPGTRLNIIQMLVSFTMYLDAVALLPQLYLLRHMVEVEPLTSQYVGLLVLSRIIRIVFWIHLILSGDRFIGLFLADLLHTVLAGDYLYLWLRKLRIAIIC